MIALGAPAIAQAAGVVAGVAWLAELDFAAGMQRWCTAPGSITSGGYTWTGLGLFAGVGNLTEGADSAAEQITLSLSVVDPAMLALAMGQVEGYRGRAARLYLQLLDATCQPVGSPVKRWAGVMNKVQIERRPAEPESTQDGTGTINLLCTRSGMARARHSTGLRLTDAQQRARYPGDTGLQYVRTLIEQPARWLSKEFQKQ
jgi:hypothetical protein